MAIDTEAFTARVKRNVSLPVALGFGISRPEQVAAACRYADAAVVGSAIVKIIADTATDGTPDAVRDYVRWLKSGL
ncbi:MAG: tryptophan synthase subunit alpha, partial [Acidobacteria bacterium]|nr:tryptophan synthase subunit alpha [Acidobacteriota bacterium]